MNPRDLQVSVYDELRKLAAAKMALENPDMSLTATTLVHEAWIKLARRGKESVDRTHFLRTAAKAMRQILIDHARSKKALRNGGGVLQISLQDVAASEQPEDLIALDEALKKLAAETPNYAELI